MIILIAVFLFIFSRVYSNHFASSIGTLQNACPLKPLILPFFVFLLSAGALWAQPELGPHIGLDDLPLDDDPICEIPLYLGSFYDSGLFPGALVNDFTLYDLQDNAYTLSDIMADGKPVLLVGGSYTCPVFRGKLDEINEVAALYGDQLNVFIIYVLEPHPINDISPYYGVENVTNNNINYGVLYEQPTTYGERKFVLEEMLNDPLLDINVPILIDGPCNAWWETFGPAPNNAYLISPEGTIWAKHGWFDKYPDDIFCDLHEFMDLGDPCSQNQDGMFEFYLTGDSVDSTTIGEAGTTLYVTGGLENVSDSPVLIEVKRLQEEIPTGWATAMCTDICLSPTMDTTSVLLEAGEFLVYTMYFYTDETPGMGQVLMGFRNANFTSNQFVQPMFGISTEPEPNPNATSEERATDLQMHPNPAQDWVHISLPPSKVSAGRGYWVEIFSAEGSLVQRVWSSETEIRLPVAALHSGLHLIHILDDEQVIARGKLLVQ